MTDSTLQATKRKFHDEAPSGQSSKRYLVREEPTSEGVSNGPGVHPTGKPLKDRPFTNRDELLSYLNVRSFAPDPPKSGRPLLAPRSFVRRMTPGDISDPLLRQVLPAADEDEVAEGFSDDPVGDEPARLKGGLIQKYKGRALLPAAGTCALNCRFCFRRNSPAERFLSTAGELDAAVRAADENSDIRELILSGGDPLTLPYDLLERLLARLSNIRHIERIRIHTRLPIADPSRIDDDLTRVLFAARKPVTAVLHTNHPAELNDETARAAELLRTRVQYLLNQSVLLKGVNDSAQTLVRLFEKLSSQGILPYYLHQLDRAQGLCHFEVPAASGLLLMEDVRGRCPGWIVPRYVQEVPGMPGKTVLL